MQRVHLNLPPEMLDRIDAIVGANGRSKFAREAIGQLLDRLAPIPEQPTSGELFEDGGRHEMRLTAHGTTMLLKVIRKSGFDQVMATLGYTEPRAFLHILLGHSAMPDRTTSLVAQILTQHR